ncbi:hypothetical protein TNCV_3304771 [Trichonephila clavipes]|nr:hypothetical protein TNCV_3304771 [Trichonephila clavipes]
MATLRERSFSSQLLLSLSVFLYRRYGSERLIGVPYSLGFAASYGKTVQYEISTAYHPQPRILSSESAYEKPIGPGYSKILHDDQALTENNFNGVGFFVVIWKVEDYFIVVWNVSRGFLTSHCSCTRLATDQWSSGLAFFSSRQI